ncbi:2OG-Fe(II) oxygenase [Candidatus Woesearchaeota archaeon]|nr:2OG-Fe(II) oxygenase [Candidatus Woesearchaeota archaeon]
MQLKQWIHQKHLQNIPLLQKYFSQNKPFPHLILPNFFHASKAIVLLSALKQEPWQLKDADLFRFHQTPDLRSSRNKFIQQYYHFFSSKEFLDYISTITNTKPLRSIDAAGQTYTAGDHLLPHDDRLAGRKIAYLYYLTKNFTKSDGGQLDFFASNAKTKHPATIMKSIIPHFNTLVLFKVSERSFHQVREIISNKKRISIGGWFHGTRTKAMAQY